MKLTKEKLKRIIKEEMNNLDEMDGPWTGTTHDTAAAFGNKDEEEFRMMVDELIGRRGMPARALHRIIDEVEGNSNSSDEPDQMNTLERQKAMRPKHFPSEAGVYDELCYDEDENEARATQRTPTQHPPNQMKSTETTFIKIYWKALATW